MWLSTINKPCIKISLTIFRMGIFGAAHGYGGRKSPVFLPEEDPKNI